MPLIKRKYIIWFVIICIAGFFSPFIIKDQKESYNAIISTSFAIVGGLTSIATLIVAVLLFDRFGVNAKFKDRQVEKVIELAKVITSMQINVLSSQLNYLYNVTKPLDWFETMDFFAKDKKKTILITEHYLKATETLYILTLNAWLPQEIKGKMDIFKIYGIAPIQDPSYDHYVRLSVAGNDNDEWFITTPKLTFEMYLVNMSNLFGEIERWLMKHSNIQVDFKGDI